LSTEKKVAPAHEEAAPTRSEDTGSRDFRRLWGANSLSNLGDGLYTFMLPVLALQVTSSPALVAGVTVMLGLAWPLFGLQAGSIVDRADRRALMLLVNGLRTLVLAGITAALLTGVLSLPVLYAAALMLGIGETLMDTALTSVVPAVVGRERLGWANARITAAQTVTNSFVGPPLAGYLLAAGSALATGVSTLMYVGAGVFLTLMRGSFRARQTSGRDEVTQAKAPTGRHLTEGLRFLWANRLIRDLTLFTAAMNLFWGAWAAVLVVYAVAPGPVGLSPFEYSLLLTSMAAGGVLGSVLCERIRRALGTHRALWIDVVGMAALLGVPALTTNPVAIGAATFAAGLGASVWVVLVATIRQSIVPDALLGRVYSASRLISWGIGPAGAALAGVVAQVWGVQAVFAIGGLGGVALMVLFPRAVRAEPLASAESSTEPVHQPDAA
jgi:MFS family permease